MIGVLVLFDAAHELEAKPISVADAVDSRALNNKLHGIVHRTSGCFFPLQTVNPIFAHLDELQ
jgi:hypothetical protein